MQKGYIRISRLYDNKFKLKQFEPHYKFTFDNTIRFFLKLG